MDLRKMLAAAKQPLPARVVQSSPKGGEEALERAEQFDVAIKAARNAAQKAANITLVRGDQEASLADWQEKREVLAKTWPEERVRLEAKFLLEEGLKARVTLQGVWGRMKQAARDLFSEAYGPMKAIEKELGEVEVLWEEVHPSRKVGLAIQVLPEIEKLRGRLEWLGGLWSVACDWLEMFGDASNTIGVFEAQVTRLTKSRVYFRVQTAKKEFFASLGEAPEVSPIPEVSSQVPSLTATLGDIDAEGAASRIGVSSQTVGFGELCNAIERVTQAELLREKLLSPASRLGHELAKAAGTRVNLPVPAFPEKVRHAQLGAMGCFDPPPARGVPQHQAKK